MKRKALGALLILLTVALFAGSAHMVYSPNWAYEVRFDGELVGFVNSLDEYTEIISTILHRAEEQWGCEVVMNEQAQAVRVRSWDYEPDPQSIEAKIESAATYITSGWAIVINGNTTAFVDSEVTAIELIEEVKNHFRNTSRSLVSVSIQEEVEFVRKPVDPDLLMDPENVLALLISGDEEFSTYVVKRGDTLSGIARSANTSLSTLRDANPNLRGDNLQIGQVLNMQTSSALLHVKAVEEVRVKEAISHAVQYRTNPDLSVRNDQVIQAGSNGEREVVYRVETINGVEVKRTQVSASVSREPVPRIVMPGSGHYPLHPTGMFRFPINTGRISSPFGASRPGGSHRGLDIAAPTGTPIYAAADGTVRTRAYGSSYGNYVVVDHANGYSTLYAHASSIPSNIRAGVKVVRGQVIAYVGNTGNSTGPHLHWEVIRNGQAINPMNFFRN